MIAPGAVGAAAIDEAEAAEIGGKIGIPPAASTGEYAAGSEGGKFLSPGAVFDAAGFLPMGEAATIIPNFGAGFNFTVTLTANRVLGAPDNLKPGQCGVIEILQDATGSRLLTFDPAWKFPGGEAPVLSTAAGARDLLSYFVLAGGVVFASLIMDVR